MGDLTKVKKFGILSSFILNNIQTRIKDILKCRSCGKPIVIGEMYFSNRGSRPKYYHYDCARRLHFV